MAVGEDYHFYYHCEMTPLAREIGSPSIISALEEVDGLFPHSPTTSNNTSVFIVMGLFRETPFLCNLGHSVQFCCSFFLHSHEKRTSNERDEPFRNLKIVISDTSSLSLDPRVRVRGVQ